MVPRNNPRQYRDVMKGPKFVATMESPAIAKINTSIQAEPTERSPAAIGK